MTKVYIAGPVSMIQDYNRPAFEKAKTELLALGYEVECPSDIIPQTGPNLTWLECMRACIKRLVDCERIYLLNGWSTSRGAKIEWDIAKALGIDPLYLEGDYEKFY